MSDIHTFVQGGHNILLDVNSGVVNLVDDLIYKIINHLKPPLSDTVPLELYEIFKNHEQSEIDECYDEIYTLYREGILFSEDECEKYAGANFDAPTKAICLHVAHDCNLRCRYCFADTGNFGGDRGIMSPDIAKRSIDFLIQNSFNRKELEVDFFGGEPLMAWETVTETVDYARSLEKTTGKRFNFTLTTNGLLLDDEKNDYINREMSNIVLSLDGRREVNDLMRPTPNNTGSYDIILPKFKKLIEGRTKEGRSDYYVRGTFTKNNLDFTEDIKSMYKAGFRQISIEPASLDESIPFALTKEDLPKIFDEYDRLYELIKDKDYNFNFFHFNIDLDGGPCVIKRLRGCGAGYEYLAVTPNGDIFPCHQFVGIESMKMGNINSKPNSEIARNFADSHIYSKNECRECWARFYCSGGCNAEGFLSNGDLRKPKKLSCEIMKKRVECAIALSVERALES